MATSSEFKFAIPPADFPLTTTLYVDARNKIPAPKCPLCCNSRKVFYCQQCIRDGNFFHSNPLSIERYAEKKLNLAFLKKELKKIEEICGKILGKQLKANRLKNEIDACRDRLKILETLIHEKKQIIYSDKHRLDALIKYNQQKSKLRLNTLNKYRIKDLINSRQQQMDNNKTNRQQNIRNQDKLSEAADITEMNRKYLESQLPKLLEIQEELRIIVGKNINNLTKYIFPIGEVKPPPSTTESDTSKNTDDDTNTITEIADASRTNFVRGKWIFSDNSGELQHCIVAPTLPGSGDYSAYNTWVATNKTTGPIIECIERNHAYSILAALTYITQFVNVLSFYLDVRLPYRLNYSEFCGNELSEQQFGRKVAKLNANILHLCLSQNIDPESINPTHTLNNLITLVEQLQIKDSERNTPYQIDSAVAMSLEEPLNRELEANYDASSDEESDHLPFEWEAVGHCQESFNPETILHPNPNPTMMATTQQATSIAGGLVTSAAASIASIFRGWTGK